MTDKPEFSVAVYGVPPDLLHRIAVVFRHIRHGPFRFVLVEHAGAVSVDFLLVGVLPGAHQPGWRGSLPVHPAARTVYVSAVIQSLPTQAHWLTPQRVLPDLLPLLNRLAAQAWGAGPTHGHAGDAPAVSVQDSGPPACKVWVLQANSVVRQKLGRQLQNLGYEIRLIDRLSQVSERRLLEQADALLVDRDLAHEDALAWACRLRRSAQWAQRPIWMMTANVRWRDVMRCAWRGLDGYLALPVAIEDLQRRLAERAPYRADLATDATLVRA